MLITIIYHAHIVNAVVNHRVSMNACTMTANTPMPLAMVMVLPAPVAAGLELALAVEPPCDVAVALVAGVAFAAPPLNAEVVFPAVPVEVALAPDDAVADAAVELPSA